MTCWGTLALLTGHSPPAASRKVQAEPRDVCPLTPHLEGNFVDLAATASDPSHTHRLHHQTQELQVARSGESVRHGGSAMWLDVHGSLAAHWTRSAD
jgi:hypothetical protein